MGSIEGIYKASHSSLPMESVNEATLIRNLGLEGDRYAKNIGTYSVFRASEQRPGEREPGRQVTLISADSVRETLGCCADDLQVVRNLRRNIAITGISAQQLLDATGHVIQIGESCRIMPHRNCVPCMYNEKKNKIPKLMTRLWYQAGVSCEVLQGGTIKVGDSVKILHDDETTTTRRMVDPGKQSPGFFLHPSKRTAEMAKEGIAQKRQTKQELEKIDPEGVERLAQSYASVGLTFWPPTEK